MLTTNNSTLAAAAEKLRNHGAEISEEERHNGASPYLLPEFNHLGFNYRMTDLQGAVGVEQLKKLDNFISERNNQAVKYSDGLSKISWLKLPETPPNSVNAWQSYVVRVEHPNAAELRNKVMKTLELEGIATRPGTHAIHTLGYYKSTMELKREDFPNSLKAAETSMAIPLHNKLTSEDQERVVESIRRITI